MAKRSKKKQAGPGVKRGAPNHFQGFKRQFLDSHTVFYQQALDSNKVSEFYNKITRDFIAKYGDAEPFAREPEEDPPSPSDNVPATEHLDEVEALEASKRFTKLRTVSTLYTVLVPEF